MYVFVQQMTGKRIGLNKLSEALVGVSKTLDSGADVENLWKDWIKAGNQKALKTIQEYCKNDVRMTALVFFYLLHFKKLYIDGEEYDYDIPKFITYANVPEKKPSSTG